MKEKVSVFFVLLALLAVQPMRAARQQPTQPPSVEPRAKEMLRQMADYLGSLNSFGVRVQTTRETIAPSGLELDSDQAFDLHVQRPDRLHGILHSAAGEKQFFYDGRTFTIYTPSLKYYAAFPAPSTLDQLFQEAVNYRLEMPAADLIFSNPYQALTHGVTSGMYVGESLVGGVDTHHLAFQTKDADWQIWILSGDQPLPVKLAITDRRRSGSPKYMAVFSGWEISPTFDQSIFIFTPAEGDRKIDIKRMPGAPAPKAMSIPTK